MSVLRVTTSDYFLYKLSWETILKVGLKMALYYFNEDCVVEAEYEKWTDKPTGIGHQLSYDSVTIYYSVNNNYRNFVSPWNQVTFSLMERQ